MTIITLKFSTTKTYMEMNKMPAKIRKGFKVTNKDMTCLSFQFELNKWHHVKGEIVACSNGFHWCKKADDCFNYYSFNSENRVFEIEAKGKTVDHGDKSCSRSIRFVRELTWTEVLEEVNTGKNNTGRRNSGDRNSGYRNSGDWNSGYRNSGDWNSGDSNSGDRNSGYRNSGDWNSGYRNSGDWNSGDSNSGDRNSGYRNSGDWNSGDWNSCNRESGFFNSKQSKEIRVFNKPCKFEDWEKAEKPRFIFNLNLTIWVWDYEMSDKEKEDNPNWEVREGYLKTLTYKGAWREAYKKATKEDIKLLKKLPNFDAEVFKEITGLEVK